MYKPYGLLLVILMEGFMPIRWELTIQVQKFTNQNKKRI